MTALLGVLMPCGTVVQNGAVQGQRAPTSVLDIQRKDAHKPQPVHAAEPEDATTPRRD
jgi:hypothetical protein